MVVVIATRLNANGKGVENRTIQAASVNAAATVARDWGATRLEWSDGERWCWLDGRWTPLPHISDYAPAVSR